jgi:hypothetical protein
MAFGTGMTVVVRAVTMQMPMHIVAMAVHCSPGKKSSNSRAKKICGRVGHRSIVGGFV